MLTSYFKKYYSGEKWNEVAFLYGDGEKMSKPELGQADKSKNNKLHLYLIAAWDPVNRKQVISPNGSGKWTLRTSREFPHYG